MDKEIGRFIGKRCPRCGNELLGNKLGDEWCSFVECSYGIENGIELDELCSSAGCSNGIEKRKELIKKRMTNQKPTNEQLIRIESLRTSFKNLSCAIIDACPEGEEQDIVLRLLEEALTNAVKSIVFENII